MYKIHEGKLTKELITVRTTGYKTIKSRHSRQKCLKLIKSSFYKQRNFIKLS